MMLTLNEPGSTKIVLARSAVIVAAVALLVGGIGLWNWVTEPRVPNLMGRTANEASVVKDAQYVIIQRSVVTGAPPCLRSYGSAPERDIVVSQSPSPDSRIPDPPVVTIFTRCNPHAPPDQRRR